jgi:hypothetical protein
MRWRSRLKPTCRDRHREVHLVLGEIPPQLVIGHELSDDLALRRKRDETERADLFLADRRLDRLRLGGVLDIRHEDRMRIVLAGLPWRMAVDRLAICFGQPAPGDETHHAGIIEK